MKILFYTNCAEWPIRYYLSRYYENIEYDSIPNYQFVDYNQEIPIEKLQNADIFIYQEMNKKFGIRSTDLEVEDNLLTHLSNNCLKISIPYPYNNVNWILVPPAIGDGNVGGWGDTSGYVNAESILKLKRKGYSLQQILDLYNYGILDFDIPGRVERYYNELTEKDKTLDVKFSDFIQENAKTHQLFFTQNHMTSILAGHISNQIFEIMGTSHRDNPFGHPLSITHIHGGSYTHSLYDQKFWNFKFPVKYSNELFNPHIKNVYNLYD